MSPWLHNECTSKEKTYRLSGIVSIHLIIVIRTHELKYTTQILHFFLDQSSLKILVVDHSLANCPSGQHFSKLRFQTIFLQIIAVDHFQILKFEI